MSSMSQPALVISEPGSVAVPSHSLPELCAPLKARQKVSVAQVLHVVMIEHVSKVS